MCSRPSGTCWVPLKYPHSNPLGTPWVSPRRPTVRGAGTLDQQKATVERVSKEIGALADLVEENEAKGRMGQVCASKAQPMYSPGTMRRYSHTVLTRYPRGTRVPRCMSMLMLARHMRDSSHT